MLISAEFYGGARVPPMANQPQGGLLRCEPDAGRGGPGTKRAALGRPGGATRTYPSNVGIRSKSCVVNVTISCNIQLPENRIAAPTPIAFGTNDSVAS